MTALNHKFIPPAVDLLGYQHIHLVGIKGVAMTSLAQMLIAAGKEVTGCDVGESFVTQDILDQLPIHIQLGFQPGELPIQTQCVVYTAAHQAQHNPVVVAAQAKQIPVISHAEALASLANTKKTIAVCGVGGKTTTSAMVTWMLDKLGNRPCFSVGVGNIPGLNKTGDWTDSSLCVVEADEYVTDPKAPSAGLPITPRFSYLQPSIVVCTSLAFDHPDVYKDIEHTKQTFLQFFNVIKQDGVLIYNADDAHLPTLVEQLVIDRPDIQLIGYGQKKGQYRYKMSSTQPSGTTAQLSIEQQISCEVKLSIPGLHNVSNAVAALAAVNQVLPDLPAAIAALGGFSSTQRRFEAKGVINGVRYFDDYAHHPREIQAIIDTVSTWQLNGRVIIAFQPHTYSRTKQLFTEFVATLAQAPQLILLDIFASAREHFDPTITSDILMKAINTQTSASTAENVHTIAGLVEYCQTELKPGDTLITLGAGDIYQVYDQLQ